VKSDSCRVSFHWNTKTTWVTVDPDGSWLQYSILMAEDGPFPFHKPAWSTYLFVLVSGFFVLVSFSYYHVVVTCARLSLSVHVELHLLCYMLSLYYIMLSNPCCVLFLRDGLKAWWHTVWYYGSVLPTLHLYINVSQGWHRAIYPLGKASRVKRYLTGFTQFL